MDKIFIDYGKRINQAILTVIKEILRKIYQKQKFLLTIAFTLLLRAKLMV